MPHKAIQASRKLTPPFVRDNSVSLENPPAIVLKILTGALEACSRQTVSRLSMSDICHASNVSRGTLYKYFASKDHVIAASTEYLGLQFEKGLRLAANSETDPLKKFHAILAWHDHFSSVNVPDRLIFTEPEFAFGFLRDNFERHTLAMQTALTPCFEHFESIGDHKVDRMFFSEIIIRLQQSRFIQPTSGSWRDKYAKGLIYLETMLAA